jgi:hypothetical protein
MAQRHDAADGHKRCGEHDADAQQHGDGYFQTLIFFTCWLPAAFRGRDVLLHRVGHD